VLELALRIIDQRDLLGARSALLLESLGKAAGLDTDRCDFPVQFGNPIIAAVQLREQIVRTRLTGAGAFELCAQPQSDHGPAECETDQAPYDEVRHALSGMRVTSLPEYSGTRVTDAKEWARRPARG